VVFLDTFLILTAGAIWLAVVIVLTHMFLISLSSYPQEKQSIHKSFHSSWSSSLRVVFSLPHFGHLGARPLFMVFSKLHLGQLPEPISIFEQFGFKCFIF